MRRKSVGMFFLGLLLWAGSVQATTPPISLHHSLEGRQQQGEVTVLDLRVRVENRGETPLYFLSLTPLDFQPVIPGDQTLSIDTMGPHQGVDLKVRLTVPSPGPTAEEMARLRLFWAGTGQDAWGEPLEFPAISRQGGLQ